MIAVDVWNYRFVQLGCFMQKIFLSRLSFKKLLKKHCTVLQTYSLTTEDQARSRKKTVALTGKIYFKYIKIHLAM